MITREKNVSFEVIAIPVDKISYFKTEDENTDITLSVPGWHAAEDGPLESYYVLKRPASINEDIFKVALEAALRTLAALNPSPDPLNTVTDEVEPKAPVTDQGKAAGTTNTERLEKLKRTILNDSEWLVALEVSRRGGNGGAVKNPSGLPNRWKRAKKIFAIASEGRDLYPAYALDIGGQPLPLIKKIIELFGETKTSWALAVWFGTPNSWLGNKKPKDLLVSAPEKVMEAALRAKEGPVHG